MQQDQPETTQQDITSTNVTSPTSATYPQPQYVHRQVPYHGHMPTQPDPAVLAAPPQSPLPETDSFSEEGSSNGQFKTLAMRVLTCFSVVYIVWICVILVFVITFLVVFFVVFLPRIKDSSNGFQDELEDPNDFGDYEDPAVLEDPPELELPGEH